MKKAAFLLGAIALPVGLASMAAPSVAMEPQMVNPSWTGFYVDGTAGGAWGSSSHVNDGVTTLIPHIRGPVVGGGFGYNFQSGPWVTGVETDLSWADVKGVTSCGLDVACRTKVEAFGTARARLGYVLGGSGDPAVYHYLPTKAAPVASSYSGPLIYATGGFAYGNVRGTDGFTSEVSGSKWLTGWTVGGGIEWKLQGNWTAKVEYLYVNLNRKDLFDFGGAPEFVNAKMNVVRIGLSYQFATGGAWGKAPVTAKY